jgi:hypothetical protein
MTALEPINVPHAAKLKVRDFLLLHDSGTFENYAKSELIEGEIWVMNSIFSRHAGATAPQTPPRHSQSILAMIRCLSLISRFANHIPRALCRSPR